MADYEIWARNDKTKPLTPEILLGDISFQEFALTDRQWSLYKQLHSPTPAPAHHDWQWRNKGTGSNNDLFVRVLHEALIEGMMMISLEPRPCLRNASPGRQLLYIEYLETAPWNQKAYAGSETKLLGIGTCLISVGIELSHERHCEGRLGLHSLEDARSFYVAQGFHDLGFDPSEQLHYFELDQESLEDRSTR